MRLLVVVAFLVASSIGRAADQPNQFVVLSVCEGEDHYQFSLMSSADYTALIRREHHRREVAGVVIPDVSALKRNISNRIPEGSTIEWRGWEDTCYPPARIIEDIRAFAASRHIDLRIQKANEAEIKLRAQKLVDHHATLAEAAAEFGTPELLTRTQAIEYLEKTPAEDKSGREFWQRLTQHPKTLWFTPGEFMLYVFLDDLGGWTATI